MLHRARKRAPYWLPLSRAEELFTVDAWSIERTETVSTSGAISVEIRTG